MTVAAISTVANSAANMAVAEIIHQVGLEVEREHELKEERKKQEEYKKKIKDGTIVVKGGLRGHKRSLIRAFNASPPAEELHGGGEGRERMPTTDVGIEHNDANTDANTDTVLLPVSLPVSRGRDMALLPRAYEGQHDIGIDATPPQASDSSSSTAAGIAKHTLTRWSPQAPLAAGEELAKIGHRVRSPAMLWWKKHTDPGGQNPLALPVFGLCSVVTIAVLALAVLRLRRRKRAYVAAGAGTDVDVESLGMGVIEDEGAAAGKGVLK